MSKQHEKARLDAQASSASRRARLHALLFSGATLATSLWMITGPTIPKLPPAEGE
jgi:hypothetical protein